METSVKLITGTVSPHKGNGRKFGYPTANIPAPTVVEEGVYAAFTSVVFGKLKYISLPSFVFIGKAETLGEEDRRLETHIFDIPDIDYYGAEIQVKLVQKLRDNKRFSSIDELLKQMQSDEQQARKVLANA